MKSKLITILLILPSLIYCQNIKIDIQNTKWVYKWNSNDEDYFKFILNNKVEFYSDEIENLFFGNYIYDNDLISVSFDSARYMHDFFKNSMKLNISNDTLRIISTKIEKQASNTNIDNDYFFIKESNKLKNNKGKCVQ